MLNKIKNKLEGALRMYARNLGSEFSLRKISPLLFNSIQEFVLRPGKRLRPTLFILGYLGYAKKEAGGLYESAISLELLHDYMLVHDDIIDKSDLRRGKPSLHNNLNSYLNKFGGLKFNGEDLALVAGDVMYALALHTFLAVKAPLPRKERALKILIEAALKTGSGEFLELLCGTKDIAQITKEDIYRIYDLKTAYYSFAAPLAMGATLAGARDKETKLLFSLGISCGRAFQIKDDILGMFSEESEMGKSLLTDLKEAKKTLLVWYAYKHSASSQKTSMRCILTKENANLNDLLNMRRIIADSGAMAYAQNEITLHLERSHQLLASARIRACVKKILREYTQELLSA